LEERISSMQWDLLALKTMQRHSKYI